MTARITSGQEKQIGRLVEDSVSQKVVAEILDGLDLTKDAAQHVVEGGDELAQEMRNALWAIITRLATPHDFANKEASSSCGYLSGYRAPGSLAEQAARLRQLFSEELGTATANESLTAKHAGAEGPATIPRWQKLAPTYSEAVEKVLDKLNEVLGGKFYNYRKGQLGPEFLHESAKKAAAFQKLGEEQVGYDILVVNVQLGLRHRGRSVRRARAVMNGCEFGLGAYEVAILFLLNPNWLAYFDDLWIDCAGDEYCPWAGGRPTRAPFFHFRDGELRFITLDVILPYYAFCGSPSGFSVPQ